jgi:hypothetical protein
MIQIANATLKPAFTRTRAHTVSIRWKLRNSL